MRRPFLLTAASAILAGLSLSAAMTTAQPATTEATPTVPARDALRKNPIPADAGSRTTGQKIYTGNCAPCHGASGKGDGTAAHLQDTPPTDLTNPKLALDTDGTLYWKISNGHRPMPMFRNVLPDESRWNVVNYLRTLTPQPATSTKP